MYASIQYLGTGFIFGGSVIRVTRLREIGRMRVLNDAQKDVAQGQMLHCECLTKTILG